MTAPSVQLRHVGTTDDGIDLWACVVCGRGATNLGTRQGRRHHIPGLPRITGHGKCGRCYIAASRRKTVPDPEPEPRKVTVPPKNWRTRAACLAADPELFHWGGRNA